jgi:hypothetical protein
MEGIFRPEVEVEFADEVEVWGVRFYSPWGRWGLLQTRHTSASIPATIPPTNLTCLPLSTTSKTTPTCPYQEGARFIVVLPMAAFMGLISLLVLIPLLLGCLHGLRALHRLAYTLGRYLTGRPTMTSSGCYPALEREERSPEGTEPGLETPPSSTSSLTWASWTGLMLRSPPLAIFVLFGTLQPWVRSYYPE